MIEESAVKIEKIMELVMSLNQDLASQMNYINSLEEKNRILNTMKDINYYMGNSLELNEMIKNIIDVVLGVLGVTACSICITKENHWEITEQSILGDKNKIITEDLIKEIDENVENNGGEFLERDLSKKPAFGLENGVFIAISIKRHDTKFGLIAIYYKSLDTFSNSKLEFFRLLSGQLGVYFENAFLFERVSLSSVTDGLTSLYNRAHLNKLISSKSYHNKNKDFGIIMADIDNFKSVNDRYGHLFGDSVIKAVAQVFSEVSAKYHGTAFRYGGEEFILTFTDINKTSLCNAAEEIRLNFSNVKFSLGEKTESFTLSLGVSKMEESSKIIDVFNLINLADEALYAAKGNGKNRYVFIDGNLDIYLKSKEIISKMISKYRRFQEPFMIIKISIAMDEFYEMDKYSQLVRDISKSFREYDNNFYNYVGDILVVTENFIDNDVINKKLELINVKYELETLLYNNENIDARNFFSLLDNIK